MAENPFLWSVADIRRASAVSARHCSEHWVSLPGPQVNLGVHYCCAHVPDEGPGLRGAGSAQGHTASELGADSNPGILCNLLPFCLPEEKIYRLLEASGPRKALSIAKSLGMKTASEVNPYLYNMRSKHLLDLDQNSQTWTIYRPGRGPYLLPIPGKAEL